MGNRTSHSATKLNERKQSSPSVTSNVKGSSNVKSQQNALKTCPCNFSNHQVEFIDPRGNHKIFVTQDENKISYLHLQNTTTPDNLFANVIQEELKLECNHILKYHYHKGKTIFTLDVEPFQVMINGQFDIWLTHFPLPNCERVCRHSKTKWFGCL